MKALLLCLLAVAIAEWVMRKPSQPYAGSDWYAIHTDGGGV